jgi:hypothetical protein
MLGDHFAQELIEPCPKVVLVPLRQPVQELIEHPVKHTIVAHVGARRDLDEGTRLALTDTDIVTHVYGQTDRRGRADADGNQYRAYQHVTGPCRSQYAANQGQQGTDHMDCPAAAQ